LIIREICPQFEHKQLARSDTD